MAINSCEVTGNVKNLLGSNVAGCKIKVSVLTPFFHAGEDGTWISGELGETTSDSSGDFSISVIETETPGQKVKFTFDFYDGVGNRRTRDYSVVVPDEATATLSSLVAEQAPAPTSASFPASGVTVSAISGLSATNAQAAFAEHQSDIDSLNTRVPSQTASRVLVSDISGNVSSSSTTTTTLGYLDATSSVQTQLDAKVAASTLTTKGDILTRTSGAVTRLPVGADGTVLSADSGQTTGLSWISPLTNPMSTAGDIIYGAASGTATRLAGDTSNANRFLRSLSAGGVAAAPTWAALVAGDIPSLAASKITSGTLATTQGGTNLDTSGSTGVAKVAAGTWSVATVVNADVSSSAAIAYSKLNLATSIVNADVSASAAIAYSKLNLATSIVNADISGSAAIAYSKLNLGTSIVNADISGSAAIAFSKLASMSGGNVLLGNGSSVATSTAVTGDVTINSSGVTAIGTNKVTNAMAAQMATNTIKGNNTGGTANASDLTVAQVRAMLSPDSSVYLTVGNGYGSTNTKIRRFTNSTTTGSDLTYADSATNGATITVNTAGVYCIERVDYNGGASMNIGFSVNSSQLTTVIDSITAADRLAIVQTAAGGVQCLSRTRRFAASDVIRMHDGGNLATSGDIYSWVSVTRVS